MFNHVHRDEVRLLIGRPGGKAGRVRCGSENALEAHLAHDDLYPVADGGCPVAESAGQDEVETPGGTETPQDTATDTVDGASALATTDEVLGVELTVSETTAGAGTTDAVAPAAGVLPNTGAGDYVWTALAGLSHVTVGGVVLTRRRAHGLG